MKSQVILTLVVYMNYHQFISTSPSKHYSGQVEDNGDCELCDIEDYNCTLTFVQRIQAECDLCNKTSDCSKGTCIHHQNLGAHTGYCKEVEGRFFTTKKKNDSIGTLISFGLSALFLSIILLICCRVFASICSWKKCCECQCTVAFHCCCEPKIPSLRVIPATGDQRTNTDSFNQSPPPSYIELYPGEEPISSTPVPPFNLEPNLEHRDSSIVAAATGSFQQNEDDTSDWNSIVSVASFPNDDVTGCELTPPIIVDSSEIESQVHRLFTQSDRRSKPRHSLTGRPITC